MIEKTRTGFVQHCSHIRLSNGFFSFNHRSFVLVIHFVTELRVCFFPIPFFCLFCLFCPSRHLMNGLRGAS